MPRPPVLGYLQSAVADNTGTSKMDELLFEEEMSNFQPEWGTYSEHQEGYDPAREFAEGMMPVGGFFRKLKKPKPKKVNIDKVKKYLFHIKNDPSIFKKGETPLSGFKYKFRKKGSNKPKRVRDRSKVLSEIEKKKEEIYAGPEHEYWNLLKRQSGGPISLLQPSVQDAHSQINRIMFENEERNKLNPAWGSMSEEQEGYDPVMEFAEGMIPIGGALRLLKGSDKYLDMLKSVSKTAVKEKKNWEAMTDLARGGSKGQIKETPKEFLKWYKKDADKAGKDYATTKWIQSLLQ